jgi:DNA-binding transcriptional LysR family regulator
MLNLKHLYYFHVFSQELSTTLAAKRIRISVPALSNQLKELEVFLGFKLTKRLSGKLVITENGKMVAHYAKQMFSAYDELNSRISDNEKTETVIKVGISNTIGVPFAFDLLLLAVESHLLSSFKTAIVFESTEKLQKGFAEGEYDYIIGTFTFAPNDELKFHSQKLSFPVRLFVPPALVVAIEENGNVMDLFNHDLIIKQANKMKIAIILPELGSVLRTETEHFFLNLNVRPINKIECNTSDAIVQLILRGLAIGFVPSPCLLSFQSAEKLSIFGPPGGYWNHEISILTRKDKGRALKKISPLASLFFPEVK